MNTKQYFIVLLVLGCWLFLEVSHTKTYYVSPPPEGNDANDGTSGWNQAYATISNAVAKSANGDIVLVSTGTYVVATNINISKSIFVRSYNNGGYDRTHTIIDGNYPTTTNRCFYINNTGAVLAGFTIRNGRIATGRGGGIWLERGIVSNCIITGNMNSYEVKLLNTWGGGGIFVGGSAASIAKLYDSLIYGNTSSNFGGGVSMCYGTNLVVNCHIHNNIATGILAQSAAGGGGIHYFTEATGFGISVVSNCSIVSNVAHGRGGGIEISRLLKIYNCTRRVSRIRM